MYVFANPNPHKLITDDCVIRAISLAEGKPWEDVYIELMVEGYIEKELPNANGVWGQYLVDPIKTIEAMEGYYDDYSGDSGWNYNRPMYSGRRYRDSMGRFTSRDGYSRDASRQKMVDKLSTLLDNTMSDSERQAISECIDKIR